MVELINIPQKFVVDLRNKSLDLFTEVININQEIY